MPDIPQANLYEIVGSMFDAAHKGTPNAWDDVYSSIAATFDSGPGGFIVYDSQNDEFNIMSGTNDDRVSLAYLQQFQFESPFRKHVIDLKAGERFNREDHMSDDDFRQTEIYRNSFAPAGIFHLEYRVFRAYQENHRGLLLTRSEEKRNFNSTELQALAFLISYLERAFRVYAAMIEAKRENRMMAEAFDHFSHGVLVVDGNEKLIFANKCGKEIIANANGFHTDRFGKLHTSTTEDAKKFRSVLESVLDGDQEQKTGSAVMQVSRGGGLRPLEVLISPCDQNVSGDNYGEPLAIVFVNDPEQQIETIDSVLTSIYGLTEAEARIVGLLTNGLTIGDICLKLGIQQNTVRTHLKHIFSKTETSRQSELIKLILNGPANLKIRQK